MKLRMLFAIVVLSIMSFMSHESQAGFFSRARTTGERLDGHESSPINIERLYVYSFVHGESRKKDRLSKNLDKFSAEIKKVLDDQGILVGELDGNAFISSSSSNMNGHEMDFGDRMITLNMVRANRDSEKSTSAGHRLILIPEKITRNSGLEQGRGPVPKGFTEPRHGTHATGVPTVSVKIYWLLEDADDNPIAAGTTTGMADIRGFPDKIMIEQIMEEMERLGIRPLNGGH